MGKGQGKGRGESDNPLSDDGEIKGEPVWPKLVGAVLLGIFVIQILAIVAIVASEPDAPAPAAAPPPPPPPPPPAPTFETENGNGATTATTPPPPPPAPAPPPTMDRRLRVNQFENAMMSTDTLDQLDYLVSGDDFETTFESGCSIVGRGVFCGEGTYGLEAFKGIISANLNAGSETQLIHQYGVGGDPCTTTPCDTAGTVTDHYRVGDSGAHGAIIYHFVGMQIDEIFWYADAGEHVRVVQSFYNIVDNCGTDIDACNEVGEMEALDQFVGANYLAVFGPGTAKVGGATHSDTENDLMDKAAFKQFVLGAEARCDGQSCPATMERVFIVEGDTVVNHYIARDTDLFGAEVIVHAVAVHEFVNGVIAESYWYSEHTSSSCAPPSHEESVTAFLERIDSHFLPTDDNAYTPFEALNLPEFVHVDYQAVFGPGCMLLGRNQRCGPTEVMLTKEELAEFVTGVGKLFPGGDEYVATCAHDMLTVVANNASVPECTRAWGDDEITAMMSCTSVHFQRFQDVCVDNVIMSEGDTVVDTYEYRCGLGMQADRCTIDDLLPRGVVVHEFDGSKMASSYWYNP